VLLECIVAMIQHLFIRLFIDSNHIEIDLIVFKTRFLNRARQLNIASQCSPNLCPKSNPYKNDIYLFIYINYIETNPSIHPSIHWDSGA